MVVLLLEGIAIEFGELRPVPLLGDGGGFFEEVGALLIHFEEEEIGDLLDVIAVGDSLIAQDMRVVPDFCHQLLVAHFAPFFFFDFCPDSARIRSSNSLAGSSLGSCATSRPAKASFKMDWRRAVERVRVCWHNFS